MNTKYADGYAIVSEDEQALVVPARTGSRSRRSWSAKYGLAPRAHDWDADPRRATSWTRTRTAAATRCWTGVHLIWKRCHSWGNVIDTGHGDDAPPPVDLLSGPVRPVRHPVERRRHHLLHRLRGPHQDRERVRPVDRVRLDRRRPEAAQARHARRATARRLREVHGRAAGRRPDRRTARRSSAAAGADAAAARGDRHRAGHDGARRPDPAARSTSSTSRSGRSTSWAPWAAAAWVPCTWRSSASRCAGRWRSS